MMKRMFIVVLLLAAPFTLMAQTSFDVAGDGDKYYPVLFADHAFFQNRAMELEIGRSDVHVNGLWGALIRMD